MSEVPGIECKDCKDPARVATTVSLCFLFYSDLNLVIPEIYFLSRRVMYLSRA